jgi:carbamoyl-phosphate synthase small subunit
VDAILALEDGQVFRGRSQGAPGEVTGEVVFHTGMTGYQEVLTDPSYKGQIVVMTFPHIGNYGTNGLDRESSRPQVAGFVVRELSRFASSWRATEGVQHYLRQHGVPCLSEIDTRALTRHLRVRGALRGVLSTRDHDPDSLVRKAQGAPRLEDEDLIARVTCDATYVWTVPRDRAWAPEIRAERVGKVLHCVAYDFGAKLNILRILREVGFEVTVVPARFQAEDVLALRPDAVFLSNGPGDPAVATYAVDAVRNLMGRLPIFGICLGHQITALALGARTFKLKFGHHGANHPVKDLRTGRVAVTSQNHGYAVDVDSLPPGAEVTHLNLNDGTCEGFAVPKLRVMAVQHHPESSPGPHDSLGLFGEFLELVASSPVRSSGRHGRAND